MIFISRLKNVINMRKFHVLIIVAVLAFAPLAGATVRFSDNLDSKSIWSGCPNDTMKTAAPNWSDYWGTWSCNIISIVDDATRGKVWKFTWPQSMSSLGPAVPYSATGGLGSCYIGFWWKHSAGWNWGTDPTHKWVYLPVAGDRLMLSFYGSTLAFFDGNDYDLATTNHPNVSQTAWKNDTAWHKYVIYASPANGDIRVWYDDTELTWNGNNLNVNWQGSTFGSNYDSELVLGYQSRPDWGAGNISYFDGCIVATTKEEVDSWLGGGSSPPDTTPPTVTSASVNGATATVNFDETVVTTGYDSGDFKINASVSGSNIILSSPVGFGSSRSFTVATPIQYGETCTLNYTGSTDDIEDAGGNDLAPFSGLTVTNNTPNPSGNTGLPFSDTFESGNFNAWDGTSGPIAVYNQGAYAGTYSARSTITSGGISSSYADYYFGTKDGLDPVTELTWTGYVKFDSITTWPTLACKITNLNIYNASGTQEYQILLAVAGTNSGKAGQYYIENSDWTDWLFYPNYQTEGTPASVQNGAWTKLSVYCKLNTPGVSDGIIKLWVNDVLKINQTAKNIREATTCTFGKMVMTSYSGAAAMSNGYESFDNFSLVQGYSPPAGGGDTTPPAMTAFTIVPTHYNSLTVPIAAMSATDAVGVTGYLVNQSATPPLAGDAGWTGSPWTQYVFSTQGSKILYAWAKDAAGNVSSSLSDSVIIDTTAPSCAITTPASSPYDNGTSQTIAISGTASDSVGVTSVTWSCPTASPSSGVASGTTSWSATIIGLAIGDNQITVTAHDAATNAGSSSVTVQRAAAYSGSVSVGAGSGSVICGAGSGAANVQ